MKKQKWWYPFLFIMATLLVPNSATMASSQSYPTKPVRLIVPFPPGGGVDILSRILAQHLSTEMGQPVIVENRAGGNTIIAAQHVMKAKPDGYTLFMTIDSTMVMNPALYSSLPYQPLVDFTPISIVTTQPMVIAVNGDSQWEDISQLYAEMQKAEQPVQYSFGATPAQVVTELFQARANVELDAIANEGSAAAIQDVVAGHIPVLVDALSPSFSSIKSGQIRALAVTSKNRAQALPDVPALAETIIPDFDVVSWTGVFAPAGMDLDLKEKVYSYLVKALESKELQQRFSDLGLEIMALNPQQASELIKKEINLYTEVIENSKLKVN